jgi:CRP/FNR family transcriptional regulator, nitrogen fixation regulation protein
LLRVVRIVAMLRKRKETTMSMQALDVREFPRKPVGEYPPALPATNGLFGGFTAALSFAPNEEIYGEGEPADYLYVVQSGYVRTSMILSDGRRQISAFYLPGEVFGFEADEEHSLSAEALAPTVVRMVKRSAINARSARDITLLNQLVKLTATELQRAQGHILLLIKSAQERVAGFLLEMASRAHTMSEIELPMSRQDIADYLGLTIETVSRTLTQLENSNAIALLTSRRIVLRNRKALDRLHG